MPASPLTAGVDGRLATTDPQALAALTRALSDRGVTAAIAAPELSEIAGDLRGWIATVREVAAAAPIPLLAGVVSPVLRAGVPALPDRWLVALDLVWVRPADDLPLDAVIRAIEHPEVRGLSSCAVTPDELPRLITVIRRRAVLIEVSGDLTRPGFDGPVLSRFGDADRAWVPSSGATSVDELERLDAALTRAEGRLAPDRQADAARLRGRRGGR